MDGVAGGCDCCAYQAHRSRIHQFMYQIIPLALCMKIMLAFPIEKQYILARFLHKCIWYSPNVEARVKIMLGTK
jgi:hypothetical protein